MRLFRKKTMGLSLSDNHNPNYVATICKIDNLTNVEGADKLQKTIINGYDVIVDMDYKIGDIVVYFPAETVICKDFLNKNNLYGWGDRELNSNIDTINLLLNYAQDEKEKDSDLSIHYESYAKSLCGFFGKAGRVKVIRLRGQFSNGFLVKVETMDEFIGKKINWENMLGKTFDTINGELFCWKYIPPIKEIPVKSNDSRWVKWMKKLNKFSKIIPGQFEFHYQTKKLNENMIYFNPEDKISITTKIHGTSGIFSNVLCNKKMRWWENVLKKCGIKYDFTEYDNIYSSRTSIKNRDINPNAKDYYDSDVWGDVNTFLKPYIIKGMTVYGEIVGYITNTKTLIQTGYDYGCEVGKWKFMPYRITETDEYNNKIEWDVNKVNEWTKSIMDISEDNSNKLMLMEILYIGKFMDLYPDIDVQNHWNQNILIRMKNDKDNLLMEEPEPLCKFGWDKYNEILQKYKDADPNDIKIQKKIADAKSKIPPREGVVIRKLNDNKACAFKLKSDVFYELEKNLNDNGEVSIEDVN